MLTVDDIAIASHGDVYVGHAGRNRVQELDANGHLVRILYGRAAGHGGFDFTKPGESAADAQGIASARVDAGGNVYVADTGHYLIEKFSPSGRFLGSWGGNGFKPGQPTEGVGAAVAGPTGELFLTDDHLNSIIRFTPARKLQGDFGGDVLSGPGCCGGPRRPRPRRKHGHGQIDEFTPDGHLVATYAGSGASAFKDPTAVAVGHKGALYVYDQDRSALLKLERR